MANEVNAATPTAVESQPKAKAEIKKAAPKKAVAKKTPVKRKTTTAKKPAVKRKPVAAKKVAKKAPKAAAKKATTPKATKAAQKKSTPDLAVQAQRTGRSAFLAGLGFYGKAFDQMQEQFNRIQEQLETRRSKANDLYAELVKRGEKVEADAKEAIDDLDVTPFNIEALADRKKLEKQLDKAKSRFSELKDSVSLKSAA